MSGNIIGLYGASNSAVTIAATNTTGLYTGGGTVTIAAGSSTYGDANVEALLLSYTGNIQAGNLTVLYDANVGAIYTDNYYYANGAPFAGGGNSTYGNADVVTLLASFGSNVVSTTGNITAGYFIGNGSQLTGLPATYSNANVVTLLAGFGSNTISTTGNVTAGYFLGNGSQLTGLPSTYSNANVATFLADFGSNTISTTGNVTVGNLSVGAAKIISAGSNKITNVADPVANSDAATKSYVDSSSSAVGFIIADDTANTTTVSSGDTLTLNGTANEVTVAITGADTVTFGLPDSISITGNVTAGNLVSNGAVVATTGIQILGAPGNITNVNYVVANYFVGNGSYLTSLPAGNITGSFSSITVTGNIDAGNISTTGNVTISGNLFSDDITSTGVTVYGDTIITGNLTVQGNTTTINSNVVTTNDKTFTVANNQTTGANVDGAGFEVGSTAIAYWIYNNLTTSWQSNVNVLPAANITLDLGGVSNRWATVYTNTVNATGNITAGNITVTGNVQGAYILGNGSQLTGLPESYGNANVANYLPTYTGNLVSLAGPVTTTANVTANYFIGNGSQLTGLSTSSISNGTSNVAIPVSSGNVNITASGTTTFVVTSTGANVTGTLNATGNANVGNIGATTGEFTTIAGTLSTAAQTNITSVGTLTSLAVTGNITSGNLSGTSIVGTLSTAAQPNVTSLGTLTSLAVTGNVSAGNISASLGTFSTVAGTLSTPNQTNITSVGTLNYLTVAATGNLAAGNITAYPGNVSGTYILGNGSQLTGISSSLSGNLAGNLLANGFALTSTGNGNVIITADGTGVVNSSKQKMLTFAETVYAYGNTGAATITPDLNLGSIQTMTLTGNITFSSIANITTGGSGTFILTQDTTGSRILTSTMKFAGGFKTLSTAANTVDIMTVFYSGSTYYASLSRGYA